MRPLIRLSYSMPEQRVRVHAVAGDKEELLYVIPDRESSGRVRLITEQLAPAVDDNRAGNIEFEDTPARRERLKAIFGK